VAHLAEARDSVGEAPSGAARTRAALFPDIAAQLIIRSHETGIVFVSARGFFAWASWTPVTKCDRGPCRNPSAGRGRLLPAAASFAPRGENPRSCGRPRRRCADRGDPQWQIVLVEISSDGKPKGLGRSFMIGSRDGDALLQASVSMSVPDRHRCWRPSPECRHLRSAW